MEGGVGVFTCSDWVGPAISAAPVESNSTGRSTDGEVDVAGVGGVGGWEEGD